MMIKNIINIIIKKVTIFYKELANSPLLTLLVSHGLLTSILNVNLQNYKLHSLQHPFWFATKICLLSPPGHPVKNYWTLHWSSPTVCVQLELLLTFPLS